MRIHFKRAILCTATLSILLSGLLASPSIAQKIPAPSGVPPISLGKHIDMPLPSDSFVYTNGGADMPSGLINQQGFQGCFQDAYGLLGVSTQTGQPIGNSFSKASRIISFSPNINTYQSLQVELRYAYRNTKKGQVNVYLMAGPDEDAPADSSRASPQHLKRIAPKIS
jgi:hypothetical protein